MRVIKLGGTNGSGKTSVARALLGMLCGSLPLGCLPNSKKLRGYGGIIDDKFWSILGSYESACGGMDTISDKDVRLALISAEATNKQNGVVFFEGLITGKTYGAIGAFSESKGQKGKWLYAFMDTPYEVCAQRVLQRRTEKNGATWCAEHPFDPKRTLLPTYRSCLAVAKRAAAQGHRVIMLPHQASPRGLAKLLIKEVAQ